MTEVDPQTAEAADLAPDERSDSPSPEVASSDNLPLPVAALLPARRPSPSAQPVRRRGAASRARSFAAWLSPSDRAVLGVYLLTRAAVAVLVYVTVWLFGGGGGSDQPSPYMDSWAQWDWAHLLNIARYGYFANPDAFNPGHPENREAFFPGFPLALRAVHVVVPSWIGAGLLISLVAGAVAAVAIARIAELDHPAGTGQRAALYLIVSPCAVFLSAGYTEALFLAFALPAWLAARRHLWLRSCLLAAGATATRVSGLFLVAAILLVFVLARADDPNSRRGGGRRDRWLALPAFLLPLLPVAGFMYYLHAHTGDWLRWKHAEDVGWYRSSTNAIDAFRHTWAAAFGHTQSAAYALEFQAELASMAVGVLLLMVLLVRQRWPEALYVALNLWAFGTSYWYMSVDRATLLWWPLWIGLAVWAGRRPWVGRTYLALAAPLAAVWVVGFTSGHWMG